MFRAGLGLSRQAMRVREAPEDLDWDHGTQLFRVEQLEEVTAHAA
ncbi:hypothetical protein [Streptomyces sp. NPDC057582]